MHVTRETLIRVAKDTAEKSALSDPGLVAAYLTGSLRTNDPFLGNTADIDIVYVHAGESQVRREIIPLTPEIHFDIVHNPRSLYDKPKELRVHPWLGPELYDPLPLYAARHFLEYIQAAVRDRYHEPANVQLRSQRLTEEARQVWQTIPTSPTFGPGQVLGYLKSINLAANAVGLLGGDPLAERRFLIQFPARARAAGQVGLVAGLVHLLGVNQVNATTLAGFLPDWEKAFIEAASLPSIESRIVPARLGYYKLAFESMLKSETPLAILWPLMQTWTLSVSVLPAMWDGAWRAACAAIGLDEGSFGERMEGLNLFLDDIETLQGNLTARQKL